MSQPRSNTSYREGFDHVRALSRQNEQRRDEAAAYLSQRGQGIRHSMLRFSARAPLEEHVLVRGRHNLDRLTSGSATREELALIIPQVLHLLTCSPDARQLKVAYRLAHSIAVSDQEHRLRHAAQKYFAPYGMRIVDTVLASDKPQSTVVASMSRKQWKTGMSALFAADAI